MSAKVRKNKVTDSEDGVKITIPRDTITLGMVVKFTLQWDNMIPLYFFQLSE